MLSISNFTPPTTSLVSTIPVPMTISTNPAPVLENPYPSFDDTKEMLRDLHNAPRLSRRDTPEWYQKLSDEDRVLSRPLHTKRVTDYTPPTAQDNKLASYFLCETLAYCQKKAAHIFLGHTLSNPNAFQNQRLRRLQQRCAALNTEENRARCQNT